MKSPLVSLKRLARFAGVAALTALALFCPPVNAQNSPVGTWDLYQAGGGQQGVVGLTFFTAGGTNWFFGYEINATRVPSVDPYLSVDSRNLGGDGTRIGFNTVTNGPVTNIFGFSRVAGPWGYDDRGRVIGFFTELIGTASLITNWANCVDGVLVTTNVVLNGTPYTFQSIINLGCYTNSDPTTNYLVEFTEPTNYAANFSFTSTNPIVGLNSVDTTNTVSFVGKVVPGRRLTLVASTSFTGTRTYRGIPYATSPKDISGNWSGTKRISPVNYLQFFTLTGGADSNFPSLYFTTNGVGPGYEFVGFAALSSQKKIGFSFVNTATGTTNSFQNASVGSLSTSTRATKANTTGIEDPDNNITFKANKSVP